MSADEQVPDLEKVWEQLRTTSEPGTHLLRLDPTLDFNALITNPDRLLGLQLHAGEKVQFEASELAGSEHVEIEHIEDSDGSGVCLRLLKESSSEVFFALCNDLVPRVLRQTSGAAAATVLVRRFNTWQRFMKRTSGKGLSASRRRGLYGELKTLQEFMIPNIGMMAAVESWTGPHDLPQDFQAGGIAIEVKTIVQSEPQQLRISGERQLDDQGLDALLVAHHRILQHRGSGETLPELVACIRDQLVAHEGPLDLFEDRLLAAGYSDLHEQDYGQTGYTVKQTSYYRVQPGFPRLTEDDLFSGVGALSYTIDASACARFEIEPETVATWFSSPPPVVDPAQTPESNIVEYKKTAWTPGKDVKDPNKKAEIKRSLKTAVIKTVVAFLNSEGGELVIGVRDSDHAVTGIEADLLSLRKEADDLDAYELALSDLFLTHIDSRVFNQLKVRFEHHDSGTACHISVRASPMPRFGTPPPAQNEGKRARFWVRTFNATKELEGQDILDWIQEHWGAAR